MLRIPAGSPQKVGFRVVALLSAATRQHRVGAPDVFMCSEMRPGGCPGRVQHGALKEGVCLAFVHPGRHARRNRSTQP